VEARVQAAVREREAALNDRLTRAAATRWSILAAKVFSQPAVRQEAFE